MQKTKIIGTYFKVYFDKLLGEGSFGKVHLAQDLRTGKLHAVKMESKDNNINLLETESNIINYVNQHIDDNPVIKNYWYGADNKYYYLITDLLGPSLDSLLPKCNGKFSLKTVLMLAEQMISRVRYYHDRNIIHRDIKPDNFLVEYKKPHQNIYLIDFGLAKKYRRGPKKTHIPYIEDKPHIGTVRYMSLNAHEKKEQSRRDDMYSIGYVLLYLLQGRLPWQGVSEKSKSMRYKKIYQIKKSLSNAELVKGITCNSCIGTECPAKKCFKKYFDYLDTVEFQGEINYNFLISEFLTCMQDHNYSYDYQWDWANS